MKIELENVKCYKSGIFDFGNSGVTLIEGVSGIGKSSLFCAINFALFGKGKVKRDGAKSCRVKLTHNNLIIERSQTPNHLIVTEHDHVTIDDEAQEVIYRVFGKKFDIVGYIQQNESNSFLQMSPEKKLIFFESLLFQNSNPYTLRQETKKVLSEREKSLVQVQAKLEQIKEMIGTYPEMKESFEQVAKEKDEAFRYLNSLECSLEELRKKQNQIDLNCKKHSMLNEKYIRTTDRIDHSEKIINDFTSDLADITRKLDESMFTSLDAAYNHLRAVMDEHHEYERYQTRATEIEQLKQTLWDEFTEEECKEQIELFQDLKKLCLRVDEIERKLDVLNCSREALKDLEKEVDRMSRAVVGFTNCPSCNVDLAIQGTKVVQRQHSHRQSCVSFDENIYKQKLQQLEKMRVAYESSQILQSEMDNLSVKLDEFQEQLEEPITLTNVEDDLLYFINYPKRMRLIQQEIDAFECNEVVTMPSENIQDLQHNVTDYEKLVHKQKELETKLQHFKQTVKEERLELESLQKEMEETHIPNDRKWMIEQLFSDTEQGLQLQRKVCDGFTSKLAQLEYNQRVNALKLERDDLIKTESHTQKQVLAARQFIELLRHTEGIILKQSIEKVNEQLAIFLDRLFVEFPINVRLELFNQSKTKGLQLQFKLLIHYKGVDCDWTRLSGGEQSRINLGFTLAFAGLLDAPLILLDECTSHLGQSLTSVIMETIQEIYGYNRLIIIIAHQVVTGTFDRVIHLPLKLPPK